MPVVGFEPITSLSLSDGVTPRLTNCLNHAATEVSNISKRTQQTGMLSECQCGFCSHKSRSTAYARTCRTKVAH